MANNLKATVLVCTLKPSPVKSSSDLIASEIIDELKKYQVETTNYRLADLNIRFGVETDMGDGDDWPKVRQDILKSEILVVATPIWMGQPASISKLVMERLDAELAETDDNGRPTMYGKVPIVAVVGNEDGAHHVSVELFQALSDVGFTIPAGGPAYWVGEAMQSTDYQDLKSRPQKTATTNGMVTRNAVHLAGLLKEDNYPTD